MAESLYVLYESALGYGLFMVKEFDEMALLAPRVEQCVLDLGKFNSLVQTVHFAPFRSTVHALENMNCVSEANTQKFNWDENTQGAILGANSFGNMLSQLAGGWLAERVGGKTVFGYGLLGTAASTFFIPIAARVGVVYLIILRVLQGVLAGVNMPAMQAMWSAWAPVYERSRLAGLSYGGMEIGAVFGMVYSGWVCRSGIAGGWPFVFYSLGAVGLILVILWMTLVCDTPTDHPRMTSSERKYIEANVIKREAGETPWYHILTSSAVWALAVAHFCSQWGLNTAMLLLPSFFSTILHFPIEQNGMLSAMSLLCIWVAGTGCYVLADHLQSRGLLSTQNTRKLFYTAGSLMLAVLLITASYLDTQPVLAVVIMTVGLMGVGVGAACYRVNTLDIAPAHAGTLLGLTCTLGAMSGFLAPALLGGLTNGNATVDQWRVFFFVSTAVYLGGVLIYGVWGKGEEMEWARVYTSDSEDSYLQAQHQQREDCLLPLSNQNMCGSECEME